MNVLEKLIQQVSQDETRRICQKVRLIFTKIEATLSGDSGLHNAWDEICVQVQFQQSLYWDVHENMILDQIELVVKELPEHIKTIIWLQTENGFDWLCDVESSEEEGLKQDQDPPVYEDDIVYFIFNELMGIADEWSNARIREYLER